MPPQLRVLEGARLVSLALNLPGPAALMRCRAMGAACVKIEPPSGDPMAQYSPSAYADLHEGVTVIIADLKTAAGQQTLDRELAGANVLLTSFRPSALERLGLGWHSLHTRYPELSQVAIVGEAGSGAEEPGHDLTYLARHDLLNGVELPASLYADMGGSLIATEAVMQAVLQGVLFRQRSSAGDGVARRGTLIEVALADAAAYLALPRHWGLTKPGALFGGAHAGYKIYECRDGRVAVAALEPRFALALCAEAGFATRDVHAMMTSEAAEAIAAFVSSRTCAEIERLAAERDIPLHTIPVRGTPAE